MSLGGSRHSHLGIKKTTTSRWSDTPKGRRPVEFLGDAHGRPGGRFENRLFENRNFGNRIIENRIFGNRMCVNRNFENRYMKIYFSKKQRLLTGCNALSWRDDTWRSSGALFSLVTASACNVVALYMLPEPVDEKINIAPAQGWHAPIEKCKRFTHI